MGATIAVYAVFLNEPDEAVWQKIQARWPEHHHVVTGNMAFVAPEGIATTADVAEAAGLGEDPEVLGNVIACSAYDGFHRGDLLEWLKMVKS